ncbi:DNA polymerase III subunit beta [Candidatus Dojkabacteria bacterium]|nr:DNA polymerase III subunit beta [Candidatus Dojkabacteria bacterium]
MQFSCNQDTFSKYLNIVSRIVSSKPGLPILNNVMFETSKGKLMMTATDLEVGIHCWIGAEVRAEGKTTIPARQLSEFVHSVNADKVDGLLDNQVFTVSTPNNYAKFNTTVADDFPTIGAIKAEKPLLRISKEDVIDAVSKVAFSAAKDDVKPVLTGVRIEIEDDVMAFVAADGLRLSRYVVRLSTPIKDSIELLVPAKAFEELARILTDFSQDEVDDEYVDFYLLEDKNQVLFRFNDIDLVSRLIDGQFPDYKAIIPSTHQTTCSFSKVDFQNSLKVVSIIARSVLGNKTILKVDPKKKTVTMSASQADVGSNQSVFDAEVDGDSIEMAFSSRFLTDFLTNAAGEEIEFECNTPVSPGVFKIKGNDSYIHLIMPMRL